MVFMQRNTFHPFIIYGKFRDQSIFPRHIMIQGVLHPIPLINMERRGFPIKIYPIGIFRLDRIRQCRHAIE